MEQRRPRKHDLQSLGAHRRIVKVVLERVVEIVVAEEQPRRKPQGKERQLEKGIAAPRAGSDDDGDAVFGFTNNAVDDDDDDDGGDDVDEFADNENRRIAQEKQFRRSEVTFQRLRKNSRESGCLNTIFFCVC